MDAKHTPQPNTETLKVRSGIVAGKGLGDVVADFTHATHLDTLAECYTDITGNDCGCNARRAWLNNVYPG